MLCQRCQQRTATVRVTKVNNGIRETNYLCEKCAAETGALNLFGGKMCIRDRLYPGEFKELMSIIIQLVPGGSEQQRLLPKI